MFKNVQHHVWSYENSLAFIALSLVTLILHYSALDAFWRFDDGAHLLFATKYSPWQYFLKPSITILQSYANVAPYNAFFYDLNLALFGMVPRWHYAHQLALLAATAFATYRLTRIWQEPLIALLAAILFLTGLPTLYIGQQLMTGHYATGLLFSVISLHCFALGVQDERPRWAWIGALFYLAATTCKEVFVPLVVVLPFLPLSHLGVRLKFVWPYVLVAIGYTGWRYAILGQLMGGYVATEVAVSDQLRQLSSVPLLLIGWVDLDHLGIFLKGRSGLNLITLTFVGLLGIFTAYRKRLSWGLIFVALIAIVLPLVPLTRNPGLNLADRYLFLVWWAVAVLLAIFVGSLRNDPLERALKFCCCAGLVGFMINAQHAEHDRISPQLAMQDELYESALRLDKSAALFLPVDGLYYKTVLRGVRQATANFEHRVIEPAQLIVDSASFCSFSKAGSKILTYDESCNCIKDISHDLEPSLIKLNSFASNANSGIPLKVTLYIDGKLLKWELGPFVDGAYYAILGGTPIKVPAKGSVSYGDKLPLLFRIRHNAVDGTVAVSPELEFDTATRSSYSWKGRSVTVKPSCGANELANTP